MIQSFIIFLLFILKINYFSVWFSDEGSSDINAEVNPSFISVRLQDSPSFSGTSIVVLG